MVIYIYIERENERENVRERKSKREIEIPAVEELHPPGVLAERCVYDACIYIYIYIYIYICYVYYLSRCGRRFCIASTYL